MVLKILITLKNFENESQSKKIIQAIKEAI